MPDGFTPFLKLIAYCFNVAAISYAVGAYKDFKKQRRQAEVTDVYRVLVVILLVMFINVLLT